jgi:hypothetical protein
MSSTSSKAGWKTRPPVSFFLRSLWLNFFSSFGCGFAALSSSWLIAFLLDLVKLPRVYSQDRFFVLVAQVMPFNDLVDLIQTIIEGNLVGKV